MELLQGKWLGHPLHPAVVHVPVGAWLAACALDLAAAAGWRDPAAAQLALWCVGAGLVATLLAVPTGVAEWAPIKKEKPAWKLGLYHLALNLLAARVWAGNFGLRLGAPDPVATDPAGPAPATLATAAAPAGAGVELPVLVTSVAGALLVLAGGYLGCLMAFDQGTSVGRQSKKRWRRVAERGGARLPAPK